MRGSAGKPINIFNVLSPGSPKYPLEAPVREDILRWFVNNAGGRALIGGDMNSSKQSLDDGFKHQDDITYCHEENHLHGDLVVAKGLHAESMTCDVMSTSETHRMCVVQVEMEPSPSQASGSAATPPAEL